MCGGHHIDIVAGSTEVLTQYRNLTAVRRLADRVVLVLDIFMSVKRHRMGVEVVYLFGNRCSSTCNKF
jgi:hypothetical protein